MSSKGKKKSSDSVKGMAVDTWEKLEQVFESRVARVLNAMQIPSHDDVQQLAARVEALTRAVEKLAGKPVKVPAPKATKKSGTKTGKKAAKKASKKVAKKARKKAAAGKRKTAAKKKPAKRKTRRASVRSKKTRSRA